VLLTLLTSHGEKMTQDELERHLEDLTGDPSIHRALDEEVDALEFAQNVLGLSEEQDPAEAAGSVDAGKSGWDASTMALSTPANASATM
jgi:Mrp family chromosome partitioning ATPase